MKTAIYYFSGTGNSLSAARGLAERIPDAAIYPMEACLRAGGLPQASGRIGFVFPMYYSGCPALVLDFASRFDFSKAGRRFALVSYAGPLTGSLVALRRALRAGGAELDQGYYQVYPNNFAYKGLGVSTGERRRLMLERARRGVEGIAEKILGGKGEFQKSPFDLLLGARSPAFLARVRGEGAKFSSGPACSGCGLCAKVCPASNIRLREGGPEWGNSCELCLACYSFCPSLAIGRSDMRPDAERYRHPEAAAADIIAQKEASALAARARRA
jgi:ferredoxin